MCNMKSAACEQGVCICSKPKVDWSKPIQTRDGLPARLLVTNYKSISKDHTHLVAIEAENGRYENVRAYRADGTASAYKEAASIINAPPPKKPVIDFNALRRDPAHHLGLGDVRLTIAQQDEIDARITELEKALRKIAGLDYANAARNGAAYDAVQIAKSVL